MTNYEQLIIIVESFASAHMQVHRFAAEFKEQLDNLFTVNQAYPALFMAPADGSFYHNYKEQTITFYCFDRKEKDRTNVNTILTTTNLILNDLFVYLKDLSIHIRVVNDSANITPLNNFGVDDLIGWQMTLSFELEQHTSCEIPFSESPLIPVFNCDMVYSQWVTEEQVQDLYNQLNDLQNQISTIYYDLSNLSNDVYNINNQINNINNEITNIESQLIIIEGNISNQQITINQLLSDISAIQSQISALDNHISNLYTLISQTSSSGLISGGQLSINPTLNYRFDITAGSGIINDFWSTPGTVITYTPSWPSFTQQILTYLTTSTQTYIAVDKYGNILQYPAKPTNQQRRDLIILGQIAHSNNTNIGGINDYVSVFDSPMASIRDMLYEFNLISFGNIISPNGSNLFINKSYGTLFGMGINYHTDIKNPNKKETPALTATSFRYRTQAGGNTGIVSSISPGFYDVNGVVTAIPGAGTRATNQRVFLFPNNNIVIQYGQTWYTTLASAIQGLQSELFNTYSNVVENAILIGIISVRKNATDLSNSNEAVFIPVSKFGELLGGVAGISTTNLQQAYNNSSEPEILTNSTLGPVTTQCGSVANTDSIHEGKNIAGTTTYKLTGEGEIKNTVTYTTIELIAAQTIDWYNRNDLSIVSVTNLVGSPTVTIQDDGVAYTLGNNIATGSKITITATVASVIVLKINNVI